MYRYVSEVRSNVEAILYLAMKTYDAFDKPMI